MSERSEEQPRSEPVIYYTGFLAVERSGRANTELDKKAAELMKRAEAGEIFLTQRRIAPDLYEYLATEAKPRRQRRAA
jgi:hypothetical protein